MSEIPNTKHVIGFFASINMGDPDAESLKAYLWGDKGLEARLQNLTYPTYGEGLQLILFEFYLRPIPELRVHLKEIERYRPKEKSVGIPVIVDDSFFKLSEGRRWEFFTDTILRKLDLLNQKVTRNKLDFDIPRLKADVQKNLNNTMHAT